MNPSYALFYFDCIKIAGRNPGICNWVLWAVGMHLIWLLLSKMVYVSLNHGLQPVSLTDFLMTNWSDEMGSPFFFLNFFSQYLKSPEATLARAIDKYLSFCFQSVSVAHQFLF